MLYSHIFQPCRNCFNVALAVACGLLAVHTHATDRLPVVTVQNSVVKIFSTIRQHDYTQPWQGGNLIQAGGSGFIIAGRRLITNAHVVSDAAFIEVQREECPDKFTAQVAFIGHDCELAVLTVDDPAFFENAQELTLGTDLPNLNDEVIVLGYPLGGQRLSVTRGVVSRVDYQIYTHSGVDSHLVLQVDAAINPGNSGGPVLFNGQVVGVAFQGIDRAQNIGYAIPLPVINHFLTDIEDGTYHGYPELGISCMDTRNPALRQELHLKERQGGIVVNYIDPFGSAVSNLHNGDVLLQIDGHPIASDGTIILDGKPMEFVELLERKQWGDSISCQILRQGSELEIEIPLRAPPDPFAFRRIHDRQPEYLMIQGLVFAPISANLLSAFSSALNQQTGQRWLYFSHYAKLDQLYAGRTQFIALIGRLPHQANTYQQNFLYNIVSSVNHQPIASLRDLHQALQTPEKGFHIIQFEDLKSPMVLDAALTPATDHAIAATYQVPAMYHFEN